MKKRWSDEEFKKYIGIKFPNIKILSKFKTVDDKIEYECEHGINEAYAWALISPKRKFCCKYQYWDSKNKSEEQATEEFIKKSKTVWGDDKFDYNETVNIGDPATKKHKIKLKCLKHNEWFEQYPGSHLQGRFGCKKCKHDMQSKIVKKNHILGIYNNCIKLVSKESAQWLDSINVEKKYREIYLNDIKYRVDAYTPHNNTVYLYHGCFWHGSPKTYNLNDLHPIIKITYGELYNKTKKWENIIINAGYNLIVKWSDGYNE